MHDTYCYNIMRVYRDATPDEINEGMGWYDRAHALALELSPNDVWKGAGVIAALSPLKEWKLNARLARNAFATGIATGNVPMHNANAQAILDGGHPLDVMRGDKTRAFCVAIADPANSTIATIDRHAHDVAMGRVFTDKERKIGKPLFRAMSDAYVECAEYIGIGVPQIQAITWVVWKDRKGKTST
jgi:hypothetical protein